MTKRLKAQFGLAFIFVIFGMIMSVFKCNAQDVLIKFKNGNNKIVRIQATSKSSLFSTEGTFKLVEVDEVVFNKFDDLDANLHSLLKDNKIKISEVSGDEYYTIDGQTPNIASRLTRAEDIPRDESGQINFSEVIQVPKYSATKLYMNAKAYFVESFKSANDVIQMDDKESTLIIGKGFSEIMISTGLTFVTTRMYYTIKIQSRDQRYKYEIYGIYFKSYPSQYGPSIETSADDIFSPALFYNQKGKGKNIPAEYLQKMSSKVEDLINSLKIQMAKEPSDTEDW